MACDLRAFKAIWTFLVAIRGFEHRFAEGLQSPRPHFASHLRPEESVFVRYNRRCPATAFRSAP